MEAAVSTLHVVTRFAPSPTGRLHVGHGLSAILAHDLARATGGTFLLRIEDIDAARARAEHVAGIFEDLRWLGLDWDGEPLVQSARTTIYQDAVAQLGARRLAYPCFCTRADIAAQIAASGAAPHGSDGPVYPGTCRALPAAERAARIAAGEPHAWRLDMAAALDAVADQAPLLWTDATAGDQLSTPQNAGDIVLSRKDAPGSYHLCATCDDAASAVTYVVRGNDLFAATHVHRLLQALMGWPTPSYRHHGLLVTADGERIAKRHGGHTLHALREAGVDGRHLADDLRAGRFPAGLRLVE